MADVQTTVGLIPEERLDRKTMTVEETADNITIAREWYYEGAMVRRDVWVTLKRGLASQAIQGA